MAGGGGDDVLGRVAEGRGLETPVAGLLLQRPEAVGILGGASRERGLLPDLEKILAGRCLPVVGFPLGDQPVLLGLDHTGSGGERIDELVGDASEFDARVPIGDGEAVVVVGRFGTDFGTGAEGAGEFVEQDPVEALGGCHHVLVQRDGVQGGPGAVGGALDTVGDHDVGVQLGVAGSGVPVVERGGDEPSGGDLGDAGMTGPGLDHPVIEPGQRVVDRSAVSGMYGCLGLVIGHGPQHGDRLRHGEREIETGNGFALGLGDLAGSGLRPGRSLLLGDRCPAESFAGLGVSRVFEEPAGGSGGDTGAGVDVEAGEAGTNPASGRCAGLGVVAGEVAAACAGRSGVADGDLLDVVADGHLGDGDGHRVVLPELPGRAAGRAAGLFLRGGAFAVAG